MNALLTPTDVARHLKVSPSFIYRNWKALGGAKLGDSQTSRLRFRPEAIEAYIRAHETPPPDSAMSRVSAGDGARHLRRFAARRLAR